MPFVALWGNEVAEEEKKFLQYLQDIHRPNHAPMCYHRARAVPS